jgi:hypothetical protein
MQEKQAINLMEGGPMHTLCKHCGNMYSERCHEQCQRQGDFSNFAPRKLDEWELIPPFPRKRFENEMTADERGAVVTTYLSWIVTELNRIKKR